MICFPIHWQLWCAFWQKNDMVFQLILLTYSWKHIIRIRIERIKKSHKSDVSLRWYAFICGFGSDVLFTIDHLRSISFFCQNAHHDWLTKEYISNWFLVLHGRNWKITDNQVKEVLSSKFYFGRGLTVHPHRNLETVTLIWIKSQYWTGYQGFPVEVWRKPSESELFKDGSRYKLPKVFDLILESGVRKVPGPYLGCKSPNGSRKIDRKLTNPLID